MRGVVWNVMIWCCAECVTANESERHWTSCPVSVLIAAAAAADNDDDDDDDDDDDVESC